MTGIYFWQIVGWHSWMVPNLLIRFVRPYLQNANLLRHVVWLQKCHALEIPWKTYFGLMISQPQP